MITTVTLNAAVDKLYLVEDLELDTVMRVKEVCNTAGGKGLNVAKVAALAGETVRAMGFLGGFNGRYVRWMLGEMGIVDDFTEFAGETRSCVNVRSEKTGNHTEFLEPGAAITSQEAEAFLQQYAKALEDSDVITISGSVPKGTPDGFYSHLIREARLAGKQVILDTSGSLLREGVAETPTVIKPNRDEIAQLLGSPVTSRKQLTEAIRRLHHGGIPYVAVSLGAEGALLLCDEGLFQATPPQVPVANTVGCGDSMVAGFAVGLRRGMTPEEMLAYATAVSASNAQAIQTGSIDPAQIPALMEQVPIERIKE